ncbi:hypothetical protein [Rahnella laticis]|uniref:hypothetical protein n=1 Tax=Rahnella laticis TaxID=2787622 RepID=UPI0018A253D1|nr:hypothetical protein [Rahnella laticis]MBF7996772.1 hypothetical protein [Rahnella laticis]
MPQNPAAARFLPVGLQTARKNTRFSTSPFSVIFESGQRLTPIQNHAGFNLLQRQSGALKIQLNGAASRPEARRPSEGSTKCLDLPHTRMFQNMSIDPAKALIEKKAWEIKEGGAFLPLCRFRRSGLSDHRT